MTYLSSVLNRNSILKIKFVSTRIVQFQQNNTIVLSKIKNEQTFFEYFISHNWLMVSIP